MGPLAAPLVRCLHDRNLRQWAELRKKLSGKLESGLQIKCARAARLHLGGLHADRLVGGGEGPAHVVGEFLQRHLFVVIGVGIGKTVGEIRDRLLGVFPRAFLGRSRRR